MENQQKLPVCACGHDRNHEECEKINRYGFWAWLALGMGASAAPREVQIRCRVCGRIFDGIRDQAELRANI